MPMPAITACLIVSLLVISIATRGVEAVLGEELLHRRARARACSRTRNS